MSTTGITTGYETMRMIASQPRRFKNIVNVDISGIRFEKLIQKLAAQRLPVSPGAGQVLRNASHGWPTDHPHISFPRWKGATVIQDRSTDTQMHTPQVYERIRDTQVVIKPPRAWLDERVTQ